MIDNHVPGPHPCTFIQAIMELQSSVPLMQVSEKLSHEVHGSVLVLTDGFCRAREHERGPHSLPHLSILQE